MKKHLLITALSMILSAFCFGQSLDLPVDFENVTAGFYALTDFGGDSSAIVVDPVNAGNHVVKSIKLATAATWAGTTVGGTIGFATNIPFSATATIISVRVYSPTAGTHIRLKVEKATDNTMSVETEALTTVANAWETLIFDFNKQAPGTAALNLASTYNKASMFFNFGTDGATAGVQTYYWDDMIFTGTTGTPTNTEPTVAAPTPTADAAQVLSIFSDAYTNLANTNFNPNWGQATVTTQVSIAGNNSLKYAGLNYQGTNLGSTDGSNQDLSSKTTMHLDYWTADATIPLKVSLISRSGERAYTCTPLTNNSWTSVEIPISFYTDLGLSISDIYQIKIEGNGTVFLDNIYFYGTAILPANDATLSDLKVDGATVTGFSASTITYNVVLPIGTTIVPTITATPNVVGAGVEITPAVGLPGTSTVVVTATDGITTKKYSVAYTIAVPAVDLPVTFEDATMNYGLTDFGNNSSSIIIDPDNAGNHIVKTIKQVNAETWAGTTVGGADNGKAGFANPIPFAAGATTMSVRVYSTNPVGTHIRLKVEKAYDPTLSVETEALTTVTNAWETLVFDFSNPASGTAAINFGYTYNKASIFFNFGQTGAQAGSDLTYYWDDMYFGIYTGIKDLNLSNNNVHVYPNPAENNLYFTSNTTLSKVAIYNVVGKQVKEYGNVSQSINVGDLKTGVYIIRLTDTNGKTVSSKFIKK